MWRKAGLMMVRSARMHTRTLDCICIVCVQYIHYLVCRVSLNLSSRPGLYKQIQTLVTANCLANASEGVCMLACFGSADMGNEHKGLETCSVVSSSL